MAFFLVVLLLFLIGGVGYAAGGPLGGIGGVAAAIAFMIVMYSLGYLHG